SGPVRLRINSRLVISKASMGLGTDSLPPSTDPPQPACCPGCTPVGGSMINSRQTTPQQSKRRQNHRFIANQPRGPAANSVPYLIPLVLANTPAIFATMPRLPAWLPPLLLEHSSPWSCPSPH